MNILKNAFRCQWFAIPIVIVYDDFFLKQRKVFVELGHMLRQALRDFLRALRSKTPLRILPKRREKVAEKTTRQKERGMVAAPMYTAFPPTPECTVGICTQQAICILCYIETIESKVRIVI